MRNKEDIFITLLRYCKEHGFELILMNDIYDLAHQKGFLSDQDLTDIKEKDQKDQSMEVKTKKQVIDLIMKNITSGYNPGESHGRILNVNSYFQYLEYQELVEARRSSQSARMFSTWAIIISLVTFIVSFIFSYIQIINPITISELIELEDPVTIETTQGETLKEELDSIPLGIKRINSNQYLQSDK